jgi:acetyl esterase
MWNLYLKNGDMNMPGYAAPLHNLNFNNLPPAYIEALEMDTLRDEAIAYAGKLRNAGVSADIFPVKGAYHGYDIDHTSSLVKKMLEHRVRVIQNYLAK